MELFAQVVVSGLTLGSLYALVGLGFVVIYRATGVVNFGHGEMLMLGAMAALVLHVDMGVAYVFAFLIAVSGAGVLGAVLERVAYRPLRFAPEVTVIIATVAVGQIIRAGVRVVRGSEVSRFPSPFSTEPFSVAGVTLTPVSLGITGTSILLVLLFLVFFRRTRLGKGMQATAQNRDAATLVGVSVNQTFMLTWAIGSALAAVAGILLAPLIIITPDMGIIGVKGFIGAILGGFASIPGSVAGGFLLGVIENVGGVYIAGEMKDAIAFVVLLLVLFLRPQGLFGKPESKRA
jgi:branched-chain amino acid transport system permease protein